MGVLKDFYDLIVKITSVFTAKKISYTNRSITTRLHQIFDIGTILCPLNAIFIASGGNTLYNIISYQGINLSLELVHFHHKHKWLTFT
jgi:hypothetical protein